MFVFFACLYALQGVYTLFLRVQRKRTSSKAAKEKTTCSLAASLLAFGFPALLEKVGCCETRFAQKVLALIRPFLCCSAA